MPDTDRGTTTILQLDGSVIGVTKTAQGTAQLTVEIGNLKCQRVLSPDVALNYLLSPEFTRAVKEMKAELLANLAAGS